MHTKHMFKKILLALLLLVPAATFAAGGSVALNIPYLATLKEAAITDLLKGCAASGADTVRVYASYNGNKAFAFQTALGVYNEKAFKKLDHIIDQAGKNGLKVMITLMDNTRSYGGKEVYQQWTGGFNEDVFFKDKISREYFKKYIDKITQRKNSITGNVYATDPVITGWDLCSDADNLNDADGMVLYAWVNEMAAYLKKQSPDKKVAIGLKKIKDVKEGAGSYDIYMNPNIDLAVAQVSANKQINAKTAVSYIKNYVSALSKNTGKPVLMVFSDQTNTQGTLKQAAAEFFRYNGSVLVYSYAANPAYKAYPGAIDISRQSVIDEIQEAKKTAASATASKIIEIKQPRVLTDAQEAQITVKLPESGSVEIMYGTSVPLKNVTAKQSISSSGTVYIKGLKPDTEYLYAVRASSGKSSGVSQVFEFRTQQLKKLTAVPFKMSKNFIKAKNGKFWDGDREYRYFGVNNYYIRQRDNETIDAMFKQFYDTGVKVVRVGSNGEAESMEKIDKNDIGRWFRIGPDYFNEDAYKRMDYVLDSAARHNIRVIIHFTDNWEYYGGVKVYATWAGVEKNAFWTDETCKKYYRQTVDKYTTRKNTVNGKLYKDDPTIFAYDLMNEPRNEADQTGKTMTLWMDEMSSYIKSKDPNHMVTTGSDSFFLKEDGTHYSGVDFIENNKVPGIDFCCYHIYPSYEHNSFSKSTTEWLMKKFITEAHKTIGKPIVMEEYGMPNKSDIYNKAEWIDFMTGSFYKNGGNGANYWFYIDESYQFGDGFDVKPSQTEYVNIFIKYANELNKNGY